MKEIKFTENSELEIIGKSIILGSSNNSFLVPKSVKTLRNNSSSQNYYDSEKAVIEFSNGSLLQNIGDYVLK